MKNFTWYFYRLRSMSLQEMLYRLKIKIYNISIKSATNKFHDNDYLVNYLNFYEPKIGKDFIADAGKILNNCVSIFGADLDLDEKNMFVKDPISKNIWPNKFYSDINYRLNDVPGDPKIIWEISKQQYLVSLGIAYNQLMDERYPKKILKFINTWIDENPPYIGINWVSGLELSLKIISWIFSLSLIKEYISKNKIDIHRITNSIIQQTEFIYNKLSLYSSANNHLIGELMLLLYSSYFIECKYSNIWRKKAIWLLGKQIDRQFYNDGINREQSINYQLHTMEMYFLCQYILEKNNLSLDSKIIERLRSACKYINDISDTKGNIFNIGDEDGGSILKVYNENRVLSILHFGFMICNCQELVSNKVDYYDNKLFMLYGEEYINSIRNIGKSSKVYGNFLYKDGGMFIKKGKINDLDYILTFDFGNIGLPPISAHAHSDILSFNLSINNEMVLCDMGTYKYYLDNGWRNYFKGIVAHNTISINNDNQFRFLGPFNNSKSPKTYLSNFVDNNISATTECFYSKYKCKVKRNIIFDNKQIIIKDIIDSNKYNDLDLYTFFNFDRHIKIEVINDSLIKIIGNDITLYMKFDKKVKFDLFNGFIDKGQRFGWQSEKYYNINKANEIVCKTKCSKNINEYNYILYS